MRRVCLTVRAIVLVLTAVSLSSHDPPTIIQKLQTSMFFIIIMGLPLFRDNYLITVDDQRYVALSRREYLLDGHENINFYF